MTLTTEQQRIVEENMGLVRAVLSRCVNSPGSTGIYSYEDLFQIGCMGLCEAAIQYRPGRAAFSTYAYAAIRNRIYNALTYATYRREKEKLSDFPIEPAAAVSMNDSGSHELHSALLEARERLTGVARKGVDAMLYMSEGFTCREIGEKYGTSANSVTAWVSKARKALKLDAEFMRFAAGFEV